MTVREMTSADISGVMALDALAFNKPWSEQFFCDELGKDYAYYITAELDGDIVGYGGIWCIYETAELIRIAVNPRYRRKGIADMIMKELFSHSESCGCERMMLEVRKSNAPAIGLYEKHGFNEISVRRGYYDGEDAVIMEAAIG